MTHDSPLPLELDVQRLRQDFPILSRTIHGRPLVYLDSAASSQRPLAVIEAVRNYDTTSHANIHRGVYVLSEEATLAYEQAHEQVGALFTRIGMKSCSPGIRLKRSTSWPMPGDTIPCALATRSC